MLGLRHLTSFVVCLGFIATTGTAQDLRDAPPPAELPPDSFTGAQYVDSRGCAYIRAGVSGVTTWVPRVARDRKQLCGFQPTFASAPEPEQQPEPVSEPTQVPEIRTARSEPAPVPAEPASEPQSSAEPVATPAPARQPAPKPTQRQLATPAPTPSPEPTSPRIVEPAEPRVVTRAEICAGRSGILPGVINKRTGEPIDCGPDRSGALAAATAPATAPRTAPQSSAAASGGVRLTRTELCERARRTGERFVTANGREIRCGPQVEPITTSTGAAPAPRQVTVPRPAAPSAPVVAAAPQPAGTGIAAPVPAVPRPAAPRRMTRAELCAEARRTGKLYVNSATGREIRCGPQEQSPSGQTAAMGAQVEVSRSSRSAATAPISNPVRARVPSSPPPGYESVWDDGRVNPQRGLQPQRRSTVATTETVSTRSAPQASGHRFVQVGTFSNASNAQSTAQRIASSGLPARIATVSRGGRQYKIVLAGPFANPQSLGSALQTVRRSGFSDAFTRN